eukprot:1276090-Prymnesium_polylepis.1
MATVGGSNPDDAFLGLMRCRVEPKSSQPLPVTGSATCPPAHASVCFPSLPGSALNWRWGRCLP